MYADAVRGLSGKGHLVALVALAALAVAPGSARGATGFGPEVALPWLDGPWPTEVAAGAPGEVIVGTSRAMPPRDDGSTQTVPEVRVLRPGADDAAAQTLGDDGGWSLKVAANSSGRAIAAWSEQDDPGF